MNFSPYELVFGQKPKQPIMFHLSSTTDSSGNCKPSSESTCNSIPTHTHTDHLGHHPQIRKLQKGTYVHWFLNREKVHSEVYNEVHNYLNQNRHLRTFINRRFGTAQPLKKLIHMFWLSIKPHKLAFQKRFNNRKLDPIK